MDRKCRACVVSKCSYEKPIGDHIFKLPGMKTAFFFPDRTLRTARLYRPSARSQHDQRRRGEIARRAKYPVPDCGLYSTASDIASLRGKRLRTAFNREAGQTASYLTCHTTFAAAARGAFGTWSSAENETT
jgi:hypothetical protein